VPVSRKRPGSAVARRAGASNVSALQGKRSAAAQATVEGVDDAESVTLNGQAFRLADRIGLVPLIMLAVAGKAGADSNDGAGLIALHDVLRDCIDNEHPSLRDTETGELILDEDGEPVPDLSAPSEWERFLQHAMETKADGDDLGEVVKQAITALSARPSQRPGGSSAGPKTISPNSKASSRATGTRTSRQSPTPGPDGMVDVADLAL
jgi:hypothetical protein